MVFPVVCSARHPTVRREHGDARDAARGIVDARHGVPRLGGSEEGHRREVRIGGICASLKQLNIPGDRVVCRQPSGEWDLKRILDEAMLFYVSTGGPRCNVEAYLHNQHVELGASMADRVNGPHYTFVDPRYHDDAASMVKQALRLARLFAKQGYGRERLVVTVSGLTAISTPP